MDPKTWIAIAALIVSLATAVSSLWKSWTTARKANVGAYLHWLPAHANVELPSGENVRVGYHLVLHNRGPHRATNVNVKVTVYMRGQGSDKQEVALAAIGSDELPLEVLDSGGRYPIPWALGTGGSEFKTERRFHVQLEWNDARGKQARLIPLRKGHIESVMP